MPHPHAGGKPAPVVPTLAESPDSIAQSDHPMLGSRLFHRPFRGQTDADGLPYVADNSEADLLGASLGDNSVYGWAGADNLFGGSGRDLLVGGAGDDNFLGDRVFGVLDAQNWDIRRVSVADAGGQVGSRTLVFTGINQGMGGDPQGDAIFAGAGNDQVFAGGGDDAVSAGAGDDSAYGDAGADLIEGGDQITPESIASNNHPTLGTCQFLRNITRRRCLSNQGRALQQEKH
jgi:Ca2+-binding RTX toxin-like protein